jgi:hypothetical protein
MTLRHCCKPCPFLTASRPITSCRPSVPSSRAGSSDGNHREAAGALCWTPSPQGIPSTIDEGTICGPQRTHHTLAPKANKPLSWLILTDPIDDSFRYKEHRDAVSKSCPATLLSQQVLGLRATVIAHTRARN